jgi:hypothetical protein
MTEPANPRDDKVDSTGITNRGVPPKAPGGAAKGSGAGAGGGGSPEDYDSDPQAGGGSLTQKPDAPARRK